MKQGLFKTFAICAVSLALAAVSFAQQQQQPEERPDEREKRAASAATSIYVISAKAGGVNFVSGKVAVARKDATSGYLVKGDELEIGDKVSTGAGGMAEILLNPGSYVRLGENTEFEFVTTSLENLKVNIKRGDAIFEVLADNDFRVAVAAPKADFYLIKSGVYRVNVSSDGSGASARLEVWKGRAQVGDGASEFLKNGQSATVVNGGQATIAKFDRDEKDSLEVWSKERAKELAKINSRLNRRDLRNSLLATRGWSVYDAFGLWVYDPFSRTRCFLPFGYGWSSPYGYWFGRDLWAMQLPWWVYYAPPIRTQQPVTVDPNTTAKPVRGNQPVRETGSADPTTARPVRSAAPPPFMNIQRDFNTIDRGSIRGGRDNEIIRGGGGSTSTPVTVAPASPTSAPASDTSAKPSRGN
jgi:ferric-dicitrate binding protein FerR (iron transport regulator)